MAVTHKPHQNGTLTFSGLNLRNVTEVKKKLNQKYIQSFIVRENVLHSLSVNSSVGILIGILEEKKIEESGNTFVSVCVCQSKTKAFKIIIKYLVVGIQEG